MAVLVGAALGSEAGVFVGTAVGAVALTAADVTAGAPQPARDKRSGPKLIANRAPFGWIIIRHVSLMAKARDIGACLSRPG